MHRKVELVDSSLRSLKESVRFSFCFIDITLSMLQVLDVDVKLSSCASRAMLLRFSGFLILIFGGNEFNR